MGAVGLPSLTLLAEAEFAIGLDGEGCSARRGVGRKGRVARVVRRTAGIREDSGGVAPIEHHIEENTANGSFGAYSFNL